MDSERRARCELRSIGTRWSAGTGRRSWPGEFQPEYSFLLYKRTHRPRRDTKTALLRFLAVSTAKTVRREPAIPRFVQRPIQREFGGSTVDLLAQPGLYGAKFDHKCGRGLHSYAAAYLDGPIWLLLRELSRFWISDDGRTDLMVYQRGRSDRCFREPTAAGAAGTAGFHQCG